MTNPVGIAACVALAGIALGCTPRPADTPTAQEDADPALEQYVLDAVPRDVEHRTLLDFGANVHLVGYDIEPDEKVKRGGTVSLTMYWKKASPLSDGWQLFTHVLDDRGRMVQNADEVGPLRQIVTDDEGQRRQALPPSQWQRGKVYVDEQEIPIPAGIESEHVVLTVGVWRYVERTDPEGAPAPPADIRLSVVSGAHDRQDRGIVAHLRTDYVRPPIVAEATP